MVLAGETGHAQREDAQETAGIEDWCGPVRVDEASVKRARSPHERELDGKNPCDTGRGVVAKGCLLVGCLEDPDAWVESVCPWTCIAGQEYARVQEAKGRKDAQEGTHDTQPAPDALFRGDFGHFSLTGLVFHG